MVGLHDDIGTLEDCVVAALCMGYITCTDVAKKLPRVMTPC
jgi:hypothetical protein